MIWVMAVQFSFHTKMSCVSVNFTWQKLYFGSKTFGDNYISGIHRLLKVLNWGLLYSCSLQCARHQSQNAKKVWVWHACTRVLLVVTVILSSFATQMPWDALASTARTQCHAVSEKSWFDTTAPSRIALFHCSSERISCIKGLHLSQLLKSYDIFLVSRRAISFCR